MQVSLSASVIADAHHLGGTREGETTDVCRHEVDETVGDSNVAGVGVDNTLVIELGSVHGITVG